MKIKYRYFKNCDNKGCDIYRCPYDLQIAVALADKYFELFDEEYGEWTQMNPTPEFPVDEITEKEAFLEIL